MRLMIVGVNTAAGLETPDDEPEPAPEAPGEEGFIDVLGAVVMDRRPDLSEAHAAELASLILATFLEDNGVAFGEDGFDWSPEGAVVLIDEHLAGLDATPTGDDGAADAPDDNQDEAA